MQVIYAKQPFPTSVTRTIFLAGPTPRDPNVKSWRPEVIKLLEDSEFGKDGIVYSPEQGPEGIWNRDGYDDQVTWENDALNRADVILFWVPRDMATMPALTTNVEFGMWVNSGKVVLGSPPDAPDARRNRYLEYTAKRFKAPVTLSLPEAIKTTMRFVPKPYPRTGGECEVPIHIWQSESFQAWYRGQRAVGNRLDSAKVVWGFNKATSWPVFPIFWALHVSVFVKSENRNKINEVVISRMDVSSVVLYKKDRENPFNSDIVLVREFRSPVRNGAGFVFEAAGGSSFKPGEDPYTVASHEVFEETGLRLAADRLQRFENRQLLSTMSAHQSHLFAAELTAEEIEFFKVNKGVVHGLEEDSERTYVEVMKLREIYTHNYVDWGMMGMVHRVLFGPDFIPSSPDQIP